MSKQTINHNHENVEELGRAMALALGATVISLITSFSTHHIVAASHGPVSPTELTHAFEREREVLHGHTNLGRVRYPVVSGTSD